MNNLVSGVVTVGINRDWSEYQKTGTLHLHFSGTRSLLCHGYYAQNEVLRRASEIKSIPNITDLEQLSRLSDYDHAPWRQTYHHLVYHQLVKFLWAAATGLGPDSTEIRPYKKICSNCVRALATHLKLYINREEEKDINMQTCEDTSVSKRNIQIADVDFAGYAAIYFDGPTVNLDVTDSGLENEDRVQDLEYDLDDTFLNFNKDTFCATSNTLPGLLEKLEEKVYTRSSHSREEIVQDIRDGKLIIVMVQSIPFDIVVEEKVTRSITNIKHRS